MARKSSPQNPPLPFPANRLDSDDPAILRKTVDLLTDEGAWRFAITVDTQHPAIQIALAVGILDEAMVRLGENVLHHLQGGGTIDELNAGGPTWCKVELA